MGALAYTERARVRLAEPPKRPERTPAHRRRTGAPRQTSWNVLAEELVSFTPPSTRRSLAQLPGGTGPSRAAFPARTAASGPSRGRRAAGVVELEQPSRPSAVRAGDPAPSLRPAGSRRPASQPRGWRRLLPGAATLAVLVSVWFGAGGLASLHRPSLTVPASAVKVHGGYLYVARPGDTLWSIASELQPGGDPRSLVASFERQLRGAELVPGDELELP